MSESLFVLMLTSVVSWKMIIAQQTLSHLQMLHVIPTSEWNLGKGMVFKLEFVTFERLALTQFFR